MASYAVHEDGKEEELSVRWDAEVKMLILGH